MRLQLQQSPATMEGTLRSLRVIHVTLIISILLYVEVMHLIPGRYSEWLNYRLLYEFGALSLACLASGQAMRARELPGAFETLRVNPNDKRALERWRFGVIVGDTLAEAVALYGFAIHMLGGTNRQVAPFFVAAMAAMIVWWPRRP